MPVIENFELIEMYIAELIVKDIHVRCTTNVTLLHKRLLRSPGAHLDRNRLPDHWEHQVEIKAAPPSLHSFDFFCFTGNLVMKEPLTN